VGFAGSTRFLTRTANEAAGDGELRLSACISANAQDVSGLKDGEWMMIAPYGDHPSPDGSYVQRFGTCEAEQVVDTFNSVPGRAARLFKNMVHRLGIKASIPVWDGHPEENRSAYGSRPWTRTGWLRNSSRLRCRSRSGCR
jgi:hypothetical protein